MLKEVIDSRLTEMRTVNKIMDMLNSEDQEIVAVGKISAIEYLKGHYPNLCKHGPGFISENAEGLLAHRAYSIGYDYGKAERDAML